MGRCLFFWPAFGLLSTAPSAISAPFVPAPDQTFEEMVDALLGYTQRRLDAVQPSVAEVRQVDYSRPVPDEEADCFYAGEPDEEGWLSNQCTEFPPWAKATDDGLFAVADCPGYAPADPADRQFVYTRGEPTLTVEPDEDRESTLVYTGRVYTVRDRTTVYVNEETGATVTNSTGTGANFEAFDAPTRRLVALRDNYLDLGYGAATARRAPAWQWLDWGDGYSWKRAGDYVVHHVERASLSVHDSFARAGLKVETVAQALTNVPAVTVYGWEEGAFAAETVTRTAVPLECTTFRSLWRVPPETWSPIPFVRITTGVTNTYEKISGAQARTEAVVAGPGRYTGQALAWVSPTRAVVTNGTVLPVVVGFLTPPLQGPLPAGGMFTSTPPITWQAPYAGPAGSGVMYARGAIVVTGNMSVAITATRGPYSAGCALTVVATTSSHPDRVTYFTAATDPGSMYKRVPAETTSRFDVVSGGTVTAPIATITGAVVRVALESGKRYLPPRYAENWQEFTELEGAVVRGYVPGANVYVPTQVPDWLSPWSRVYSPYVYDTRVGFSATTAGWAGVVGYAATLTNVSVRTVVLTAGVSRVLSTQWDYGFAISPRSLSIASITNPPLLEVWRDDGRNWVGMADVVVTGTVRGLVLRTNLISWAGGGWNSSVADEYTNASFSVRISPSQDTVTWLRYPAATGMWLSVQISTLAVYQPPAYGPGAVGSDVTAVAPTSMPENLSVLIGYRTPFPLYDLAEERAYGYYRNADGLPRGHEREPETELDFRVVPWRVTWPDGDNTKFGQIDYAFKLHAAPGTAGVSPVMPKTVAERLAFARQLRTTLRAVTYTGRRYSHMSEIIEGSETRNYTGSRQGKEPYASGTFGTWPAGWHGYRYPENGNGPIGYGRNEWTSTPWGSICEGFCYYWFPPFLGPRLTTADPLSEETGGQQSWTISETDTPSGKIDVWSATNVEPYSNSWTRNIVATDSSVQLASCGAVPELQQANEGGYTKDGGSDALNRRTAEGVYSAGDTEYSGLGQLGSTYTDTKTSSRMSGNEWSSVDSGLVVSPLPTYATSGASVVIYRDVLGEAMPPCVRVNRVVELVPIYEDAVTNVTILLGSAGLRYDQTVSGDGEDGNPATATVANYVMDQITAEDQILNYAPPDYPDGAVWQVLTSPPYGKVTTNVVARDYGVAMVDMWTVAASMAVPDFNLATALAGARVRYENVFEQTELKSGRDNPTPLYRPDEFGSRRWVNVPEVTVGTHDVTRRIAHDASSFSSARYARTLTVWDFGD